MTCKNISRSKRARLELFIIACVGNFAIYVMVNGGMAEVWSPADAPGDSLNPATTWSALISNGPWYTIQALNRGQTTCYLNTPILVLKTCIPISGCFIFTYCVEFMIQEVGWFLGYTDHRSRATTRAIIETTDEPA